jgi:group II intron reverse transcriptase/maturase
MLGIAQLSGWFTINMITNKIKDIQEQVGKGHKVSGLSAVLADPEFLIQCWVKIRSNKGAVTPSIDDETMDGINRKWFDDTAKKMRNGMFAFRPSRRIYIPKKSGGERPLAIPSPRDKIVQEALKQLLEIVFEGTFSERSHGFRAQRGCHTALNDIRIHFGGVRWFIEGDIKRQFDLVNHRHLMNLIKDRVEDQPFIDLLYKYLRAGYLTELYGVERQGIGVPQGGVTSPILSNIYMDGLDRYMEDEIIPKWTRGVKRKQHPMYTKITRSGKAPTDVRIPRVIGNDPDFRRVRYVRYADDFLIGIIGSKEDCEEIRADIGN